MPESIGTPGAGPTIRSQAADRVRRSIEAYATVFDYYAHSDWSTVTNQALRYLEPIGAYHQGYLQEMEGIAEGAGVPFRDVFTINVRTEVMFAAKARDASVALPHVGECSAFVAIPVVDRPVLAGQNSDSLTHAFDATLILEAIQDEGPQVRHVGGGRPARQGGFRRVRTRHRHRALVGETAPASPVSFHVLLRAMLDARKPAERLLPFNGDDAPPRRAT